MSFLDHIFGTDGKGKDDGVWIWLKNQRTKHKNRQRTKTGDHPSAPLHGLTLTRIRSDSVHSSVSDLTVVTSCNISVPSSPGSPTSPFTRDSRDPPLSPTKSVRDTSSPPCSSSSSPPSPTSKTPYTYSRQRAMSTFALPTQTPVAGSRQLYQNPHQNRSFVDGPIKRSTTSRSAPAFSCSSSSSSSSVWTSSTTINSVSHTSSNDTPRAFHGNTTAGAGQQQQDAPQPPMSRQSQKGRFSEDELPRSELERVRRIETKQTRNNDGWWWE
ncbi:hypothetical protein B0O80DRAFT_431804 [Mortierella sp. GBAus27b]|nr:hypothetical protein B0O80DRAFT_431804 [Mortierella sp. GBAus27b]